LRAVSLARAPDQLQQARRAARRGRGRMEAPGR
jgi:hypothetical protein